jgi:WD40 repeat protein
VVAGTGLFGLLVAVVFLGYRYLPAAPDRLIYSVQKTEYGDTFAFGSITADGEENQEFYRDNNGLVSVTILLDFFPWVGDRVISPTGSTLAVADQDGNLLLLDSNAESPVVIEVYLPYRDERFFRQGFSPDGEYFCYVDQMEDSRTVTVVTDRAGNEIYRVEDKTWGAFLPDSHRIVVYENDSRHLTGLGVLDFLSGEYTFLTTLSDSSSANISSIYSLNSVLVAGDTIYYLDGDYLMSVPIQGGVPSEIYAAGEGILYFYLAPDQHTLVIANSDDDGIYFYDTRQDSKSSAAHDVDLINFSPSGDYIISISRADGDYALYLSKADGSDKVQLITKGDYPRYSFSPNGKRIAYLEGCSNVDGGDLYVTAVDNRDPLLLDTNVWSFRFINNGKQIVYIKTIQSEMSSLKSAIYRIDINGENRAQIMSPQFGLYTWGWPLP